MGNYAGALRQWVHMQREGSFDPIFSIVDAHAITIEYDVKELRERIFETAVVYLAAGLDPAQSIVFVQSDVPEHTELAWYLGSVTPMGELSRMTQFKEKSDQHKQNINAGLFNYPILMAADVLLYRTEVVPVGDDQVQHLELAREICRRFNARFGDVFPEPQPLLSTTPRIMGLDGKRKMSKSLDNTIDLFDPPPVIEKKLKSAFTDPLKLRLGDPGRPEICNVYTMHKAFTNPAELPEIERSCRSGELPCGTCKMKLRDSLVSELVPLQTRASEFRREPQRVFEVLEAGASRARAIAGDTLHDVRTAMGLGARRP